MSDYPKVTRAPAGLNCDLCRKEPADLHAEGPHVLYRVGPSCRAALAAPLPRKEYQGVTSQGVSVRFRSNGRDGVEYQENYVGVDGWHEVVFSYIKGLGYFFVPSCLRAIANALEDS